MNAYSDEPTIGPVRLRDGSWRFRVWAPRAQAVDLRIVSPRAHEVGMERTDDGCFEVTIDGVSPGATYLYRLTTEDGETLERPDPASRLQPDTVHAPSALVDPDFRWTDDSFRCPPMRDLVFYEVHIGTLTNEGTFDAAIARLDDLIDLGVNCVEVMPVSAFPGSRNWGYDGVQPWAVQNCYGGPDAFKRFIDACHARGIAVCLDVVYNHMGPEGNYLRDFGPYFTEKYHTPWGAAMNFDDEGSAGVRRFFIESAIRFALEFHIDAFRLDAVHAIFDQSAYPFLREYSDALHNAAERHGRRVHVIAESDLNDATLIRSPEANGYGMDAQWCDDFHHSLHALLTGERQGYYSDFGRVRDLAESYERAFVYRGEASAHRGRAHGAPTDGVPRERFIVCAQNHDQVGNRMLGDRLSTLVDFERLKLAAGVVALAPFTPLLFMGEEYGESNPFQYFVSHDDEALVKAVREGRRAEFESFRWEGEAPDPQAVETFERSRLSWDWSDPRRAALRDWWRALLRIRRETPWLRPSGEGVVGSLRAIPLERDGALVVVREAGKRVGVLAMQFGTEVADVSAVLPACPLRLVLDSRNAGWGGAGSGAPDTLSVSAGGRLRMHPGQFVLLMGEEQR